MNRAQSVVVTTTILASLVNIYGALRAGKNATVPIIGGFVVGMLLLGLAEVPNADRIAEIFGVTFLITSASLNAGDLIRTLDSFVGAGAPVPAQTSTTPSAPSTQSPPAGGGKPAAAQ